MLHGGLNYLHLHTPPILHRNLKSSNLLITEDLHVRVGDFGLEKARIETITSTSSPSVFFHASVNILFADYEGSLGGAGAALHQQQKHSPNRRVCIWHCALGSFVPCRLFARSGDCPPQRCSVPYGDFDEVIIATEVKKGTRPEIAPDVPKPFADLIRRCWSHDPLYRPSLLHVISALDEMKFEGDEKSGQSLAAGPSTLPMPSTMPMPSHTPSTSPVGPTTTGTEPIQPSADAPETTKQIQMEIARLQALLASWSTGLRCWCLCSSIIPAATP